MTVAFTKHAFLLFQHVRCAHLVPLQTLVSFDTVFPFNTLATLIEFWRRWLLLIVCLFLRDFAIVWSSDARSLRIFLSMFLSKASAWQIEALLHSMLVWNKSWHNDGSSDIFVGFYQLRYLDARYNNISEVDKGLIELIETKDVEAYFAGNHQLCENDDVHEAINCKHLCSPYCWSAKAQENGVCDVTCNSPECSFDNNDCASN